MDYWIKPPGLDHHFRQVTIKPFYLVVRSFETRWESLGQSPLWQLSNPHQAWSFDNVQVVIIKLFSSGSGESAGRDSSPESTEVVKPFSDHPSTLQFLIVPSTLELELSCASLSLRWRPSLARLDVSSTQISMPETCGSTAVLVSVTDDLVQVNFQPAFDLSMIFLISGWGTKLSLPPAGLSQIRIYEFRKAEIF